MVDGIAGNYLGIDWGESKIGLALAHEETQVAVAYRTLRNSADIFGDIKKIIETESVTGLVVGIPKQHHSQGRKESEQFGNSLAQVTGLPVHFTNEMFTTKIAQQTLSLLGEKRLSQIDDAESARILLQDWLDSHLKT